MEYIEICSGFTSKYCIYCLVQAQKEKETLVFVLSQHKEGTKEGEREAKEESRKDGREG